MRPQGVADEGREVARRAGEVEFQDQAAAGRAVQQSRRSPSPRVSTRQRTATGIWSRRPRGAGADPLGQVAAQGPQRLAQSTPSGRPEKPRRWRSLAPWSGPVR